MAGNLPNGIENMVLDALVGTASFSAPTTPMKLALETVAGTDSAAGTEVVGGSYARQTVTFAAAASGSCATNAAVNFTTMPACTVVAVAIYDNAGSPVRYWYGALSASKTVGAGDTFQIPSGQLTLSLD